MAKKAEAASSTMDFYQTNSRDFVYALLLYALVGCHQ
jgi:hypothetical protein